MDKSLTDCRHCKHDKETHNVMVGMGNDRACNSMGCGCRKYEAPPTKWIRVLA